MGFPRGVHHGRGALYARLDRAITEAGYLPMAAQIVDATLIRPAAPANTNSEKAQMSEQHEHGIPCAATATSGPMTTLPPLDQRHRPGSLADGAACRPRGPSRSSTLVTVGTLPAPAAPGKHAADIQLVGDPPEAGRAAARNSAAAGAGSRDAGQRSLRSPRAAHRLSPPARRRRAPPKSRCVGGLRV